MGSSDDADMLLSIVVPMHDEEENVGALCAEVRDALAALPGPWELVLVDDGSADGTRARVEEEARRDPRIRPVLLDRRRGQSAALCAGFSAAAGRCVATLDGDLQNDPQDLPAMLAVLEESGAAMVTGWRRRRRDSLLRRLSSRIANGARNLLTGDRIVDVGCSTRVFRRSCLASVPCFFDGMHRFFPTLFRMAGFTVREVPVNHRPRARGTAKYGVWNRLWRGIRDLFGVRWLRDRHLAEGKDVILSAGTGLRPPGCPPGT
jgi:dolichol-phosphate mannosyltransferase